MKFQNKYVLQAHDWLWGEKKLSYFVVVFSFWLLLVACGILVPQLEIEPMLPAVEAGSLNPWMAREVPKTLIFNLIKLHFIWKICFDTYCFNCNCRLILLMKVYLYEDSEVTQLPLTERITKRFMSEFSFFIT